MATGADGADSAADEAKDAIRDHNEIRDVMRGLGWHPAGSKAWRRSVSAARVASSDPMAEEERAAPAGFRRHASLPGRHDLAAEFVMFEAARATGFRGDDKNPAGYVEREAT